MTTQFAGSSQEKRAPGFGIDLNSISAVTADVARLKTLLATTSDSTAKHYVQNDLTARQLTLTALQTKQAAQGASAATRAAAYYGGKTSEELRAKDAADLAKSGYSPSHLYRGSSLLAGQFLDSPNKRYRMNMTKNGMAVLDNGKIIYGGYNSSLNLKQITNQLDGNIVITDINNRPIWDTSTHASGTHPGGNNFLNMQDDGNLVVYMTEGSGIKPIWDSKGWAQPDSGFVTFVGNAVATAGKAVGTVTGAVGSGFNAVGDLAANIPIVGPAFHGVFKIAAGPWDLTESIARGDPIDKALLSSFKDQIASIREVAPLAQTIVSFIPGIGTTVSAAMAAALALASGQPIGEALLSAVRSAIPGGALAQVAFSITVAAVSGKNILEAGVGEGLHALGLSPMAADALRGALIVVSHAAQGERIDQSILEGVKNQFPAGPAQIAFNIALSVAQGKNLQETAKKEILAGGASLLGSIATAGNAVIGSNVVFKAGMDIAVKGAPLVAQAQQAYALGVGLMAHSEVTQTDVMTIRKQLAPDQAKVFDLAVAVKIGFVTQPRLPSTGIPALTASAYFATHGMMGATSNQKADMMQTIVAVPLARAGAVTAIVQIADARAANRSWWQKLMHAIGLAA